MSTSIATIKPSDSRYEDAAMLQTIKETVCSGSNPSQFKMFIEVCKATGLNPFLKEIWFVPGVGVMAGRDGYLRVANEHPQFDGMETLVERDEHGIPIKATCKVWRKDRSHPITCEAYYNEYKKSSQVWTTYKSAMIGKVAEVLALKRSFSINGVVSEEEMGEQSLRGSHEAQAEVAERKISDMRTSEIQPNDPLGVSEADIIDVKPMPDDRELSKDFAMMAKFRQMKLEMAKLQIEDSYYAVLKANGFARCNEIIDQRMAKKVYKDMAKVFTDAKAAQPPEDEPLVLWESREKMLLDFDDIHAELEPSVWFGALAADGLTAIAQLEVGVPALKLFQKLEKLAGRPGK